MIRALVRRLVVPAVVLAAAQSTVWAASPGPVDWSGWRVGVTGGFGWRDISGTSTWISDPSMGLSSVDYSLEGAAFGLNAGGDWATPGGVVLGIDASGSFADIDGTNESVIDSGNYSGQLAGSTTTTINGIGALRGRVGVGHGRLALFGTGGLGWMHVKSTRTQYKGSGGPGFTTAPDFSETDNKYLLGWTVGGEVDFVVDQHWSLNLAYDYYDFGKGGSDFPGARQDVGTNYATVVGRTSSVTGAVQTIAAGATFRFR
jgi:opacity protein-like surface antigen